MSEKPEESAEKRALGRMARYCAQQERCTQSVREKLVALELPDDAIERIIERLKRERYLDDARYATYYVRDKARFNSWGPSKLRFMLRSKRIDEDIINEALSNVDDEAHTAQLENLLRRKLRTSRAADIQKLKAQLLRLGLSHGYSYDDTYRLVAKLVKDNSETK